MAGWGSIAHLSLASAHRRRACECSRARRRVISHTTKRGTVGQGDFPGCGLWFWSQGLAASQVISQAHELRCRESVRADG